MIPDSATPLVEACPACGTLIDVSNETPLSKIHCPSCGQSMFARRQFNNFTLHELLGQGGMGSVFKANDCNLNREVALKILRREISGDAEEREKLAGEARRTASINHPHVVKVFSFGQDRGQFYIAMELVERGSLDDLMALQKRVAEMQILLVGAQIASGLQAALEAGLIHRDIKPGNILFADAQTSKLVDFGLALIADEVAAERGEIWGTPYYIAPEKLDQQPEDFRSDIYSLGGTLFHALAGRPPYEAETASMVALKQLKSQPVSLQAFAPDVSSETAYVINRMMNKNPDERYASYDELVQHFQYAREKLLQKIQKPERKKSDAVQLQSRNRRSMLGLFSLALTLVIVALLGIGLWQGDYLAAAFGLHQPVDNEQKAALVAEANLTEARELAAEGNPQQAADLAQNILADPNLPALQKYWVLLHSGLFQLLSGDTEGANSSFDQIIKRGLLPAGDASHELANFFLQAARIASQKTQIPPRSLDLYDASGFEAFAFYLFGIKNWSSGHWESGGEILRKAADTSPESPYAWISELRPIALARTSAWKELSSAAHALRGTPAEASTALQNLRANKENLADNPAMSAAIKRLEAKLVEKAGTSEAGQSPTKED